MNADAASKSAFGQVCALRAHPEHARTLDKAINRLKPAEANVGPKIVKHSSKLLYEGQDKNHEWAPLEWC